MKPDDLERLASLFSGPGDIMFRDSYFNSAVLLLLVLQDGEYHLVFEKRSAEIRQGNEICFPGGMFDPVQDRDFQQTAVRETSEELGIPANKIKVIGKMDTLIAPQGVLVEGFLGVADISLDEISADPREVAYVFSVPVSYFERAEPEKYQTEIIVNPVRINEDGKEEMIFPAKELKLPDKYHRPWQGRKHNVYVYRYQGKLFGDNRSFYL